MNSIVLGTTPTFIFTFSIVSPSDLATAVLTFKKGDTIILRKELEDATVGDTTLSWTLTQEETIALGTGSLKAMLNWVTNDGVRGVSPDTRVAVTENHISEVIS